MENKEIRELIETRTILERWFRDHGDNHPAMREQREFYREICRKLKGAKAPGLIIRQPFYSDRLVLCGNCKGGGQIAGSVCSTCAGAGKLQRVITGQMELFRTV